MSSAIEDVLWPGFKLIEPSARLGGTLARKPGYHNSRDHLPSTDYSVAQFAIDRQGPADEASAIDLTFPDAQAGDYKTISKYSKRLYAVRGGDPRTVYMREFFGQIDNDTQVEGWDYSKNRASSSDSSHLWHIHISVHRKYIESAFAMRAILSILKGQTLAQWNEENARLVTFEHFTAELPQLWRLDEDPVMQDLGNAYVARAQRLLEVPDDGIYGIQTVTKAADYGLNGKTGTTIDTDFWRNLIGMWPAQQVSSRGVPGTPTSRPNITLHKFANARLPILKFGDSDDAGGVDGTGAQYVRRLQRAVRATVDGDYGPETATRVKEWNGGEGDGKTVNLALYRKIHGLMNVEITGVTTNSKKK